MWAVDRVYRHTAHIVTVGKIMAERLDIFEVLGAIDMGGREVWDELTDKEKSQIGFPVVARWCSSVSGSREKQELAVLKVNEYVNKNLYNVGVSKNNDNRKLLWHCLCMSGNTDQIERHNWIKLRRTASKNPTVELLHKLKPELGLPEVQLLAELCTKQEIRQLVEEYGIDPKTIK